MKLQLGLICAFEFYKRASWWEMGFADPCNTEANTLEQEGKHISHFRGLLLRASVFGNVSSLFLTDRQTHTHAHAHAHIRTRTHTIPQAAAVEGRHRRMDWFRSPRPPPPRLPHPEHVPGWTSVGPSPLLGPGRPLWLCDCSWQ